MSKMLNVYVRLSTYQHFEINLNLLKTAKYYSYTETLTKK